MKIWIYSFANAILMLGLTFLWLSLPYTFGDEAFLIKWTSLIKKSLMGIDPKPDPEEVLFIDVSGNKVTIDQKNEFGEISPFHRDVLTNRAHLSMFFEMINKYVDDTRYVFCDVLFDSRQEGDSTLEKQIQQLGDKFLGVSHLNDERELITPVMKIPYALSTYQSTQDLFLKYPLVIADTLKTVPLVLNEKLNNKKFHKWGPFYSINRKWCFKAPLVDFKLRPTDFRTGSDFGESNFTIYKLGTLLESREFMEEEDLKSFFDGKVVMIGDFEYDMHETPFDEMPGLIILYNAFLTIQKEENVISLFWVLFMLTGFTLISFRIFSSIRVMRPRWLVNLFESKFGKRILNALDEIFLLALMTMLSFFIFNIHINILFLFVFLKIIEFFWGLYGRPKVTTAISSTP